MYPYTYTCRIHIDAIIKTSEDFVKKNIPLTLFERFVCERELVTEQRLQHIDLPRPSGHRRVSFSFSWAAQPGAWGPASLGHDLIPTSEDERKKSEKSISDERENFSKPSSVTEISLKG